MLPTESPEWTFIKRVLRSCLKQAKDSANLMDGGRWSQSVEAKAAETRSPFVFAVAKWIKGLKIRGLELSRGGICDKDIRNIMGRKVMYSHKWSTGSCSLFWMLQEANGGKQEQAQSGAVGSFWCRITSRFDIRVKWTNRPMNSGMREKSHTSFGGVDWWLHSTLGHHTMVLDDQSL